MCIRDRDSRYRDEEPPLPADQAGALLERLRGRPYRILIEPGRAIVGNAGLLVTRVELLKQSEDKSFAVVDAAMNDLLRPALYSAWQAIIPVAARNACLLYTSNGCALIPSEPCN